MRSQVRVEHAQKIVDGSEYLSVIGGSKRGGPHCFALFGDHRLRNEKGQQSFVSRIDQARTEVFGGRQRHDDRQEGAFAHRKDEGFSIDDRELRVPIPESRRRW